MHDSHFFPALPTATYFWRLGQAGRGCGNDRHGPEGIGRDRLTPPPPCWSRTTDLLSMVPPGHLSTPPAVYLVRWQQDDKPGCIGPSGETSTGTEPPHRIVKSCQSTTLHPFKRRKRESGQNRRLRSVQQQTCTIDRSCTGNAPVPFQTQCAGIPMGTSTGVSTATNRVYSPCCEGHGANVFIAIGRN